MLIAFEGPDKTGKSTSAAAMSHDGVAVYNMNVYNYAEAKAELERQPDLIKTFDRIDWLTHMVYRLALPAYEWNDERPRTVFAAPDTHLVFKLHPIHKVNASDELYNDTQFVAVNRAYHEWADWFIYLNRELGHMLYKSITVMRVLHTPDGGYEQSVRLCSTPTTTYTREKLEHIKTNADLEEFLRTVDHQHFNRSYDE